MVEAAPLSKQHTLAREARVSGVGLFTGQPCSAVIKPADAGTGVVFRRVDLPSQPTVPASVEFVVEATRRTALQKGEARVELVEHILSALAGLGIDNAVVDVDGPELPAGRRVFIALHRRDPRGDDQGAGRGAGGDPGHRADHTSRRVIPRSRRCRRIGELDGISVCAGSRRERRRSRVRFTRSRTIRRNMCRRIAPARTFSTETDARALWEAGHFRHLIDA